MATNESFFLAKYDTAVPYDRYLQTGSEEQRRKWLQVYELAHLTDSQKLLLSGFEREMKILVFTGIWCGDCVQQCPLLQRIAETNSGKIDLRFVERPVQEQLPEELQINGGSRVPVVLFFSEDGRWCGTAGDRPLNRYRALALDKLGPSCPTGIIAPEQDELDATLADWLNEFERIQLMLRLTPRLREKYAD